MKIRLLAAETNLIEIIANDLLPFAPDFTSITIVFPKKDLAIT